MDWGHTDTQPQSMLCDDIEMGRWKHRKHVCSSSFPPHALTSVLWLVAVQCVEDIPPAISRLCAAIAHIPRPIKAPVAVTGSSITYLTAPAGSINHHQP